MNTNASPDTTSAHTQAARPRRGCLFYVKRGLIGFGIVLIALVVLGVAFQAIAIQLDKRNYPPPGQLYAVNGHQMHLVCKGEGDPTVILQAGGTADSIWWYWVQNQLADHTRVCAFDRPGMGWSESTTEPRDALTLMSELHALLEEADVRPPYVMAGHSWGAVLTRIYAAQYPQEIAGITLVDSAILLPKHFADQSEFDAWKSTFAGQQALFGAIMRLGLPRLTDPAAFQKAGYPSEVALELVAMHSRNDVIDTDYEEFQAEMWALTKASAAAEDLGDLPMAVLWAPESWKSQDTYLTELPAARAEISSYSANSVTRSIEGADHVSILGNEAYARQVSDAVLDVMEAVRTGTTVGEPIGTTPMSETYRIRIKGHLAAHWAEWFDGMTITRLDNGETLIEGPIIDQAALHGMLNHIRDLGLLLLTVERIEPDENPYGEGR